MITRLQRRGAGRKWFRPLSLPALVRGTVVLNVSLALYAPLGSDFLGTVRVPPHSGRPPGHP
ncbi:hypothetical protein ACNFR7_17760 [Streptomyces sp. RM1]